MALKRKRCDEDISAASSTSTRSDLREPSQSPSPYAGPLLDSSMSDTISPPNTTFHQTPSAFPPALPSSHLHSRTRKRHRDNRPDENIIHELTLQRLLSAQRSIPHNSPPLPSHSTVHFRDTPTANTPLQTTLHSFWSLPALDHATAAPLRGFDPLEVDWKCEDCDATLGRSQDIHVVMDYEMSSCQACARSVCDTCAVVRGEKVCLQCA